LTPHLGVKANNKQEISLANAPYIVQLKTMPFGLPKMRRKKPETIIAQNQNPKIAVERSLSY
jgi:hypothetical protein